MSIFNTAFLCDHFVQDEHPNLVTNHDKLRVFKPLPSCRRRRSKYNVEDQSVPIPTLLPKPHNIGDNVWCKWPRYPWWPCKVTGQEGGYISVKSYYDCVERTFKVGGASYRRNVCLWDDGLKNNYHEQEEIQTKFSFLFE